MSSFAEKWKLLQQVDTSEISQRLWAVFSTARIALAILLMLIQAIVQSAQIEVQATVVNWLVVLPLLAYLVETVALRWLLRKMNWLQNNQLWLWALTVGVDFVVFAWLYWSSTDYTGYLMLFMFSVLMVAALGPRWLIYSICALITGVMLLRVGVLSANFLQAPLERIKDIFPSLLSCLGLLGVGEVVYQLAVRTRKEEHRASAGLSSAKQQEILNRIIVAEMSMGVVVADRDAILKMVNPAAIELITGQEDLTQASELNLTLNKEQGWGQLQEVVKILFGSAAGNRWLVFDFLLKQNSRDTRMLQIKGRLLEGEGDNGVDLCVLFLSDMREVDKRMQQEKLAAMGRMSASIAHEIRNPLATIASANTLLSEGLHDKGSLRLSQMIATNADRLSRIVKDVLDVAHMQGGGDADAIDLLYLIPEVVQEWERTNLLGDRVQIKVPDDIFGVFIVFDEEHFRRVLINLLDNALRYSSHEEGAIVVSCRVYQAVDSESVRVSVYSDGEELDDFTEKSLFEPFFSTEARGTGLGLFICRNLCYRYGASLDYQHTSLSEQGEGRAYNEFYITSNRVDPLPGETQVLLEQAYSKES